MGSRLPGDAGVLIDSWWDLTASRFLSGALYTLYVQIYTRR